jgi:hypothetical protein
LSKCLCYNRLSIPVNLLDTHYSEWIFDELGKAICFL